METVWKASTALLLSLWSVAAAAGPRADPAASSGGCLLARAGAPEGPSALLRIGRDRALDRAAGRLLARLWYLGLD